MTRNLRAGADHMLLFIEGDDAREQAAAYDGHPHVTAIPTDHRYWRGLRPPGLNPRQTTNATLAAAVLSTVPGADWLFHIDGDETLHLDTDYLSTLTSRTGAVRLRTLEAASDGSGDVCLFKRELRHRERRELAAAGVIPRPSNRAYFRGHTSGKAGVRPSPFVSVGVHRARTNGRANLHHHAHPSLSVLHYEGVTPDEFTRKWRNLALADARHSPDRGVMVEQVREILRADLPAAEQDARLRALYDQYGRDDVARLAELGVLVTPDPAWHARTPSTMDADQAATFRAALDLMLAADRRHFIPQQRRHFPADVLRSALASRRVRRHRGLVDGIRSALAA